MSQAAAATVENDLDQILSQIENLQNAGAKIAAPMAAEAAAQAAAEKVAPTPESAAAASEPEADLAEFRGEGGEASLEETLATLEEEPASGKSLFDDAASAETGDLGDGGNAEAAPVPQSPVPQSVDELVAAAGGAAASDETSESTSVADEDISELVDEKALEEALAEAEARINESELAGYSVKTREGSEKGMSNVHKMADHKPLTGAPSEGGLTLSVQGSMTLALIYERENSKVMIQFQDGYLCLQMPDGTEVKIPVKSAAAA